MCSAIKLSSHSYKVILKVLGAKLIGLGTGAYFWLVLIVVAVCFVVFASLIAVDDSAHTDVSLPRSQVAGNLTRAS